MLDPKSSTLLRMSRPRLLVDELVRVREHSDEQVDERHVRDETASAPRSSEIVRHGREMVRDRPRSYLGISRVAHMKRKMPDVHVKSSRSGSSPNVDHIGTVIAP